jgi:hypothetical protein
MCLWDPTVEGNRVITALSVQCVSRLPRPREVAHLHVAGAGDPTRTGQGAFNRKSGRCGARAHSAWSLSAPPVDPLWSAKCGLFVARTPKEKFICWHVSKPTSVHAVCTDRTGNGRSGILVDAVQVSCHFRTPPVDPLWLVLTTVLNASWVCAQLLRLTRLTQQVHSHDACSSQESSSWVCAQLLRFAQFFLLW